MTTSFTALNFALRRLAQGLRAGELRVIVFALVIASTAAVTVGLFSDRVQRALDAGSAETLGADAIIAMHDTPGVDLLAQLHGARLRVLSVAEFPSVVLYGEQTQLASVKAVDEGYPLRGQVQLMDELFGAAHAVRAIPARGTVWVDPRLWTQLGLQAGSSLQVGASTLAVAALIADEPGRGGSYGDVAPELLMNAADLPATQLVGPGSRVSYSLQLAGDAPALVAARKVKLPLGARFIDPQNARPALKQTLQRARSFLNLAVLATLLLSASAIALSARQHAYKLRDEVALLKCLGARVPFLRSMLLWQIGLLGCGGVLLGAAIGVALQAIAVRVAAPALGLQLPAASAMPLLPAMLLVILLLAGFALPPLLAALRTPPLRVFQRAADAPAQVWPSLLLGAATVGAMLWLQAGDLKLAAYVLAGAVLTAGSLALCAALLIRLLAPLRARVGVAWQFGLGNLVRRRGAAIAQVVALGVAMLALLLVTVVREDMLSSWQNRLPQRTPNQFLINIQPQQIDALRSFFKAHGYDDLPLWPMTRARLVAVNGVAVTPDSFSDPETRRWINREFNLSWIERFGDDNELVQGPWWDAAARGQPWLSVEEYGMERLKLKLGDTLTLDFAGQSKTLTVHNVRKVKWDSFRPNFFLVTPPGTLEDVSAVQWLTSFYLPPERRVLLRDLVHAFPNITAIDLDAALAQVRSIMSRIVHALEFILSFALLAGLVVMLAVIEGSRAERVRETGVLRALGASSRVITQGLLAEYAVLGLLAGAVAAIAAQLLAWTLALRVFEIPYGPRPMLWLIGSVAGCVIVTFTGWLSLRSTLRTPPRIVLAAG